MPNGEYSDKELFNIIRNIEKHTVRQSEKIDNLCKNVNRIDGRVNCIETETEENKRKLYGISVIGSLAIILLPIAINYFLL